MSTGHPSSPRLPSPTLSPRQRAPSTMSYSPARGRYARPPHARRDSSAYGSDDEHVQPSAQLSAPRPAFMNQARDSSSWYSGSEPASDSETPPLPPMASMKPSVKKHGRVRSRSDNTAYAPLDFPDQSTSPQQQEPQMSPTASLRSAVAIPLSPLDPGTPMSATSPGGHQPLLASHPPIRRTSFSRGSVGSAAPPPSAFPYPFQSHPGNPDPIPGSSGLKSRRASLDSILYRPAASSAEGSVWEPELERPYAPFMAQSGASPYRGPPGSVPGSQAALQAHDGSPRASTTSFRAPFLSPASRPSSVAWSPPAYYNSPAMGGVPGAPGSATGTSTPLPGPKPPLPSTLLAEKLRKEDKPWLHERDTRSRASYWITLITFFLGVAGATALAWQGWVQAGREMIPDNQLCSVFSDDFSSLDVDSSGSKWTREVSLGGFGNNEFEMTTNSDNNLFVKNGQLYIMPTLTTDTGGVSKSEILNGGNFTLDGCTSTNPSNCTASSNGQNKAIPPIQSARLTTANYSTGAIKYGKVEVIAKLPTGDWLWPAIWMLPKDNQYGPWPISGEIDIMEARGNGISYAQGINFVRSTLTWGPMESLIARVYGWQSKKQSTYATGFHTYTLEWTDSFMKAYVDSRLTAMVDIRTQGSGGKSVWDRGDFPEVAQNGSSQVVVTNPYSSPSAPFDQEFYLILNLAAGGTSGWFPDNVADKPWIDGSDSAMYDFAKAQDTWSATWPDNEDERAFRIDSVKMWKLC